MKPSIVCIDVAGTRDVAERLESAAAAEFTVRWLRAVDAVRGSSDGVWCVVLLEREPGEATSVKLARLTRAWPNTPRLLVVTSQPSGLGPFGSPLSDGIVAAHRLERRLVPAIWRVRLSAIKARARLAVALTPVLSSSVRRAVIGALYQHRSPRSVDELAAMARRSRATLSKGWRVGDTARWTRLEDFIDWLVLLDAVETRLTCTSWARAAGNLGVHERSLARRSRRFLGVDLRGLFDNLTEALDDDRVDSTLAALLGINPNP